MAQGIKVPFLPLSDIAGRASYFEAAYLNLIELNDYRLTPVGSLFECNSRY
jgi:hypothetical protein